MFEIARQLPDNRWQSPDPEAIREKYYPGTQLATILDEKTDVSTTFSRLMGEIRSREDISSNDAFFRTVFDKAEHYFASDYTVSATAIDSEKKITIEYNSDFYNPEVQNPKEPNSVRLFQIVVHPKDKKVIRGSGASYDPSGKIMEFTLLPSYKERDETEEEWEKRELELMKRPLEEMLPEFCSILEFYGPNLLTIGIGRNKTDEEKLELYKEKNIYDTETIQDQLHMTPDDREAFNHEVHRVIGVVLNVFHKNVDERDRELIHNLLSLEVTSLALRMLQYNLASIEKLGETEIRTIPDDFVYSPDPSKSLAWVMYALKSTTAETLERYHNSLEEEKTLQLAFTPAGENIFSLKIESVLNTELEEIIQTNKWFRFGDNMYFPYIEDEKIKLRIKKLTSPASTVTITLPTQIDTEKIPYLLTLPYPSGWEKVFEGLNADYEELASPSTAEQK